MTTPTQIMLCDVCIAYGNEDALECSACKWEIPHKRHICGVCALTILMNSPREPQSTETK